MKLIIDVPEEVYEALKGITEDSTSLDPYSLADIIVNKSQLYEERPHGEWIEVPVKRDILHPNGIKYVCSACKRDNCYGKPPFCMWCGATMKSEEEEQHESQ